MKQTLEGVLKYLRKNYCSYWIILGIDTAIAVLCTWIAYIGIYSMTGISVRTDVFAKIIGISFISSILGSYIFRTYRQYHTFFTIKGIVASDGKCMFKSHLYGYCYLDFHTSNGLVQQSENDLCIIRWYADLYCNGWISYSADTDLRVSS